MRKKKKRNDAKFIRKVERDAKTARNEANKFNSIRGNYIPECESASTQIIL